MLLKSVKTDGRHLEAKSIYNREKKIPLKEAVECGSECCINDISENIHFVFVVNLKITAEISI